MASAETSGPCSHADGQGFVQEQKKTNTLGFRGLGVEGSRGC